MVEFALAFPIIMVLFMGFADFSRLIFYRSAIDFAADKALRVAQTDARLETGSAQEIAAVVEEIRTLAVDNAAHMGVSSNASGSGVWLTAAPQVKVPGIAAGEGDSTQSMESSPIQIQISAQMNTFIPFMQGTWNLTNSVSGYRQILPEEKYPRAMCKGSGTNGSRQLTEGGSSGDFGINC
jgi:Flp pilus assembly protein TadG